MSHKHYCVECKEVFECDRKGNGSCDLPYKWWCLECLDHIDDGDYVDGMQYPSAGRKALEGQK